MSVIIFIMVLKITMLKQVTVIACPHPMTFLPKSTLESSSCLEPIIEGKGIREQTA